MEKKIIFNGTYFISKVITNSISCKSYRVDVQQIYNFAFDFIKEQEYNGYDIISLLSKESIDQFVEKYKNFLKLDNDIITICSKNINELEEFRQMLYNRYEDHKNLIRR